MIGLVVVISIGIILIKDYQARINTYGDHMCQEVYGLDENCE